MLNNFLNEVVVDYSFMIPDKRFNKNNNYVFLDFYNIYC